MIQYLLISKLFLGNDTVVVAQKLLLDHLAPEVRSRVGKSTVKSNSGGYGSDGIYFYDARVNSAPIVRINVHPGTMEVTGMSLLSNLETTLPGISAANPTDSEVTKCFRVFRPTLSGDVSFHRFDHNNLISFQVLRSIDGVPVSIGAIGTLIEFNKDTGKFDGFSYPPSELGMHRLSAWPSGDRFGGEAMSFAFTVFKGVSQLDLANTEKSYVNASVFSGMANPKYRGLVDPTLKNTLLPCYKVRLNDADSYRKDGTAMQLIDAYYDAEDNSLMGYIIWSAGGLDIAPAKSLDGESFDLVVMGGKESKVGIQLTKADGKTLNQKDTAVLYSKSKAIRVFVDRQSRLISRGGSVYHYDGNL